jgi:hypothetical protein
MNQMFNENCEACVHNQSVNNTLLRLARLEEKVDELGSNNDERLTDLEEALQVAYNRINKLEDYIAGIEEAANEEASEDDTISECSICCQCTRCEEEGGYEYYKADSGVEEEEEEEEEDEEEEYDADGAEPLDEFALNDDFVPVSYYEDDIENIYVDVNQASETEASETEDQVVPEMITVQFAGHDEEVQFPSALHCQLVSSIPEDGHVVQAMPMCMYPQDMHPQDMHPQYMIHEQDMRLNYNPVLCAEEEKEEEEFPWNSQALENGDLLYGTCSDEYEKYYEKYYEERTAAILAAIDEEQANDCAAFYQFKALDVDRNNGLDERIAQVLGQDPANEDDDDQEEYYNEEYINHNYSCHCNY